MASCVAALAVVPDSTTSSMSDIFSKVCGHRNSSCSTCSSSSEDEQTSSSVLQVALATQKLLIASLKNEFLLSSDKILHSSRLRTLFMQEARKNNGQQCSKILMRPTGTYSRVLGCL